MGRGIVVVGVAGGARAVGFASAWARTGEAAPAFVPWQDALRAPETLRNLGRTGDYLRVESPGADPELWQAFAALGGLAAPSRARAFGVWRPGRAWFGGLSLALRRIEAAASHLEPTHPADDILTMTDTLLCHRRLAFAGVPVPALVEDIGTAADTATVDEFRAALRVQRRHAVFVKPRWGSSGAGVLAYRWHAGGEQLTTTARLEADGLANDKQLRTFSDRASIDRLLGTILADGAIVQRWVPKAGVAAGPFDLRVLVVAGHVAQWVARVGRGTITNLHLDAARLDPEVALAPFGARAAGVVKACCIAAAACFPRHLAVAVDVMVDPRGRPFVLECNAWGDYLPRLLAEGRDSYETQAWALRSREVAA